MELMYRLILNSLSRNHKFMKLIIEANDCFGSYPLCFNFSLTKLLVTSKLTLIFCQKKKKKKKKKKNQVFKI